MRNPAIEPGEVADSPLAAQLALVHEAMGIVTWVWDIIDDRTDWYGDLSALLGLAPQAYSGGLRGFMQHLHPEDVAASRSRFVACLKGNAPTYHVEERVIWPDGSMHWLETYGRGSYGPDGRAVRIAGVVKDITERKRVEHLMLASEDRFRRLIEESQVPIGMSRGERVIYANPAFAAYFGYASAQEAVGRPVVELVAPDDRNAFVQRTFARLAGQPIDNTYELALLRGDGTVRQSLVSVTLVALPEGPAVLVFLQDITERVRAQAALRQERDRANQYLRVAQSILVVMDDQARVTLLNRKGHQLLGYAEGELLGQDWYSVVLPPDEVQAARSDFQAVISGRQAPCEYVENQVLTRRGERRHIAWRQALVFDDAGRICGSMNSGEDITERRAAEQALHELNASLERRVAERTAELNASNAALAEARDAAEAARLAKGSFLAHMSHEIRTPMNAILGISDLALRLPGLQEDARSYLSKIKRAGGSLLGIINDILDFSKIESGKLGLETQPFVLDEVLEKVTALVGFGASDKGLEFLLGTAADVPRRLLGDPLRLGQVLLNLCSNAVKFTDAGEVMVVTVKAAEPADGRVTLRFAVRDTGIGIAPEQQRRLFQPFDQLDATTTRKYGGTGLGLAICRQLVELMGGEIGVHSVPGRGSEFHFTIAFGVVAPAAPAPATDWAGCRVLVVDDSGNAREVMQGLMQQLGCPHDLVESATTAYRALADCRYDLVLIDWRMPGEDGFEVARRIQAQAAAGTLAGPLPALAMVTAYGDDATARRALAEGFVACVAKPVTATELSRVLARGLGRTPPEAAAPATDGLAPIEQLGGRRILLVEDNELNQIVAGELLSGVAGATVKIAHDGQEALDALADQPFDLVLMDVQMPGMDGYEATRRLRANPAWRSLPVVAMTAHAMASDRQLCLDAGMNDFVSKPFEPSEFFQVLARWLPRRPGQPAATDAASDGPAQTARAAVSFELGLHRCMGRGELYAQVLRLFFETHAGDVSRLRHLLAGSDLRSAAAIVHSLASTAAVIGATALASIVRDLEQALGDADLPRRSLLLAAFEPEFQRVLEEVESHLRSLRADAAAAPPLQ